MFWLKRLGNACIGRQSAPNTVSSKICPCCTHHTLVRCDATGISGGVIALLPLLLTRYTHDTKLVSTFPAHPSHQLARFEDTEPEPPMSTYSLSLTGSELHGKSVDC
jgi:hypothetical protein